MFLLLFQWTATWSLLQESGREKSYSGAHEHINNADGKINVTSKSQSLFRSRAELISLEWPQIIFPTLFLSNEFFANLINR